MPVSVDHIVEALSSLGGKAHLDDIVRRVGEISPPPLPHDIGASVRARIQERCREAQSYKGGDDLFYSVFGIGNRKGWWGLNEDLLSNGAEDGFVDGAETFLDDEEGKLALHIHLRRERSQRLVRAFKNNLTSFKCAVCDFDFEKAYGELAKGYIEAHHTIPVATMKEGHRSKLSELIGVCANCHRVLHLKGTLRWEELRTIFTSKLSESA